MLVETSFLERISSCRSSIRGIYVIVRCVWFVSIMPVTAPSWRRSVDRDEARDRVDGDAAEVGSQAEVTPGTRPGVTSEESAELQRQNAEMSCGVS
ncbi:hypothetical protein [Streptomyces sp. NPDC056227]|uniref:hypothetical protein n=1 Tax=Streptomyces sp. NPDC056227 TaxID=3345753 RepID=UPI0035D5B682